ncbi:hypothetical protein VRU48_18660 [Pedobacter sp. KR3-3]|uniref:Uncharacterized protein n=1 Tax=Pedobacter albus TaxID=3113905 RepID=A0ABU7ICE3_9SPHI|nr:hypothetical protein [Pedobacter sp. KR3-3]MEE1947155.1 hypothetical protein [Pedobacter sp. KR3-3]
MKSFKKMLRLLGLVLLLFLAVAGVGLAGGIPPRPTGKRDEIIEINVDLADETTAIADAEQQGIKS